MERMKKKKKWTTGLALGLAVAVGLGGCGQADAQPETETMEQAAIAVSAEAPVRGTMAVSGTFVGTVSPQEQVSIVPLVSGEVTEVNFEVGDYVEAGSVLVRIDDEAARLQLESAQLTRQGAELAAQRTLGSTQVMSNLNMENSINSIQFQIDQAKKQYSTAGDSVADAREAREDMQDALDKINNSISDMENGYDGMKGMAAKAKQLVVQNPATGIWQWKADPANEPNWEEEYYTSQEEEDAANQSGAGDPPPAAGEEGGAAQERPSEPVPSEPDAEEESGQQGGDTTPPSTEEGGGIEEVSSEAPPEPEGEKESAETEGKADSQDTQESEAAETVRQTEPVSEPPEKKQESDGQKETAAAVSCSLHDTVIPAASSGRGGEKEQRLTLEQIRRHERPGQVSSAALAVDGNEEYKLLSVTNTSGGEGLAADPGTGEKPKKKPYAEYLKAKAPFDATRELIAAGYSPADIGEGRMDSSVASYASQIASLKSQAATLESNLKSMDGNIESAQTAQSTTADTIDYYEDNLKNAQIQYGIQNGQAYQDTAATLANQIASSDIGIASARMQLDNYVLTAPISGTIEQKNVDDFGMVSAGNPVYVISNKDSMTITFYVSEAVKNHLAPGQSITLERNGQTCDAAITQVGQSVDPKTSLFEVKAAAEGSSLANGVTVKITADTYRAQDVLLIPYDAVYFEGDTAYVYCVEGDTAVRTQVQTGTYNEDQIEITEGLTEEDVVIRSWSPQLTDGAKVRVVTEEAEG